MYHEHSKQRIITISPSFFQKKNLRSYTLQAPENCAFNLGIKYNVSFSTFRKKTIGKYLISEHSCTTQFTETVRNSLGGTFE